MPDHHPEAGDHGAGWRYRGYDVAIRVQPRHAGEYLLMTDVACGGARWSRHRDVAAASASAALCLAREQARALVDALSADGD